MLAYDEQEVLLTAMLQPSQTLHPPLLTLLKRMAEQQRISAIAEASGLYLRELPHQQQALQHALAEILAERYFPQLPGLSAETFQRWAQHNTHWEQSLEQVLTSPSRLSDALAQIAQRARQDCPCPLSGPNKKAPQSGA